MQNACTVTKIYLSISYIYFFIYLSQGVCHSFISSFSKKNDSGTYKQSGVSFPIKPTTEHLFGLVSKGVLGIPNEQMFGCCINDHQCATLYIRRLTPAPPRFGTVSTSVPMNFGGGFSVGVLRNWHLVGDETPSRGSCNSGSQLGASVTTQFLKLLPY